MLQSENWPKAATHAMAIPTITMARTMHVSPLQCACYNQHAGGLNGESGCHRKLIICRLWPTLYRDCEIAPQQNSYQSIPSCPQSINESLRENDELDLLLVLSLPSSWACSSAAWRAQSAALAIFFGRKFF